MADIIVAMILIIMISFAVGYIMKAKKKGKGCLGCPNSAKCSGNCDSHKM